MISAQEADKGFSKLAAFLPWPPSSGTLQHSTWAVHSYCRRTGLGDQGPPCRLQGPERRAGQAGGWAAAS